MSDAAYTRDIIDRYVYQVAKRLPADGRAEVERELRANIADMLEARCGEREPARDDVDAVLLELGPPAPFADRYRDRPRRLIGPELIDIYWLLVRIVLIAVVAGTALSVVLQAVKTADVATIGDGVASVVRAFVDILVQGIASALCAFGAVTLSFALMDAQGVRFTTEGNFLGDLPPVPQGKARISRSDSIVSLAFLSFFALLFVLMPQWLEVIVMVDGRAVPLIDVSVLTTVMPLVLIGFVLSAAPYVLRLIDGRYTGRLCAVTIAANVLGVVLAFIVLRRPIWAYDTLGELLAVFGAASPSAVLDRMYEMRVGILLAIIVLGSLGECASVAYRTWRYGSR